MWRAHRSEALNGSSQQPPSQGVNNRADGCMTPGSGVSNGVSGIPGDLPEYVTLPSYAGLCEDGRSISLAARGIKMENINNEVGEEKDVQIVETIVNQKTNNKEKRNQQFIMHEFLETTSKKIAKGPARLEIQQDTSEIEELEDGEISPDISQIHLQIPEYLSSYNKASVEDFGSLETEQTSVKASSFEMGDKNSEVSNLIQKEPKTSIAEDYLQEQDSCSNSRSEDTLSSKKADDKAEISGLSEGDLIIASEDSNDEQDINKQKLRDSEMENVSENLKTGENPLKNSDLFERTQLSKESFQIEPSAIDDNTSCLKSGDNIPNIPCSTSLEKESLDCSQQSVEEKYIPKFEILKDLLGEKESSKNVSETDGSSEIQHTGKRNRRGRRQRKRMKLYNDLIAQGKLDPRSKEENSTEGAKTLEKGDDNSKNLNDHIKVAETGSLNVASSSKEKSSILPTQIGIHSKPIVSLTNKSTEAPVSKKKKKSKNKGQNRGYQVGNQRITQPFSLLGNLWGNGINPAILAIVQAKLMQNPSLLTTPSILTHPPTLPAYQGNRQKKQPLLPSPLLTPLQGNLSQNQGTLLGNNQVQVGQIASLCKNEPNHSQNKGKKKDLPKNQIVSPNDANLSESQVISQNLAGTYMSSFNTEDNLVKNVINQSWPPVEDNLSRNQVKHPSTLVDFLNLSRNNQNQERNEEKYRDTSRNQNMMRLEVNQQRSQMKPHDLQVNYFNTSNNFNIYEASTSRYQQNLGNPSRNQWSLENLPRHRTSLSQHEANSSRYPDNLSLPSTSRTQEQFKDFSNFRDYPRRKRESSRDTATHSPHDIKRSRSSERDSSFQENDLTRVIISENFDGTGLEIEELMHVRIAISHEIDRIQTGPTPRFNNTYLESGGIVVECADIWSRDWLTDRVPKLSPWSGARLRVVDPPNLEVFHRAVLWIPGLIENAEVVLARLERQNPGLKTGDWRVYCGEEKFDPRGYNLIVGIPDKCVGALKGLDFKPYLGMSRVTITLTHSDDQGGSRNSSPRR